MRTVIPVSILIVAGLVLAALNGPHAEAQRVAPSPTPTLTFEQFAATRLPRIHADSPLSVGTPTRIISNVDAANQTMYMFFNSDDTVLQNVGVLILMGEFYGLYQCQAQTPGSPRCLSDPPLPSPR